MGGWGIATTATKKEKIKAHYADELHAYSSTSAIDYDTYDVLFDFGMELLDKMYEQGKADSGTWIKVSDKVPQPGIMVLAYSAELNHYWILALGDYVWKCITHWMPLPEAPTMERDKQ